MIDGDWSGAYAGRIAAVRQLAARAPVTFCGMGACVDSRVSLHDAAPLFDSDLPEAAELGRELLGRVGRGVGGEIAVEWRGAASWIAARIPIVYELGGTGPHAASALSILGAPTLLALERRSASMLALVPPGVLLAEGDDVLPAAAVRARGDARNEVFIFEYTAGRPVAGIVPTRSSRVIVRFGDIGVEDDAAFDRATRRLASGAGAAVVSGFSAVPPAGLDRALERTFAAVRSWRASGLPVVHLELAGYVSPDVLRRVLNAARGVVTSVGMSHSEFVAVDGVTPHLGDAMASFGEALEVERVCVHADHWAATVTRRDAETEQRALLTGCLLASARASAGRHVSPSATDPAAIFEPLPFPAWERRGPWNFVACASPYIVHPATTLGLGDTFTAGCLLVLGSE